MQWELGPQQGSKIFAYRVCGLNLGRNSNKKGELGLVEKIFS